MRSARQPSRKYRSAWSRGHNCWSSTRKIRARTRRISRKLASGSPVISSADSRLTSARSCSMVTGPMSRRSARSACSLPSCAAISTSRSTLKSPKPGPSASR